MTFNGGPTSVWVRGNLVYKDGEIVGEHGSGKFVERRFTATPLEAKV
jgi:dihydropyrimidinase